MGFLCDIYNRRLLLNQSKVHIWRAYVNLQELSLCRIRSALTVIGIKLPDVTDMSLAANCVHINIQPAQTQNKELLMITLDFNGA